MRRMNFLVQTNWRQRKLLIGERFGRKFGPCKGGGGGGLQPLHRSGAELLTGALLTGGLGTHMAGNSGGLRGGHIRRRLQKGKGGEGVVVSHIHHVGRTVHRASLPTQKHRLCRWSRDQTWRGAAWQPAGDPGMGGAGVHNLGPRPPPLPDTSRGSNVTRPIVAGFVRAAAVSGA